MAEFMKKKESELNSLVFDYFNINNVKNYEKIIITDNDDYNEVVNELGLGDILCIPGDKINDDIPMYTCLKNVNNSKVIYLKERLSLLEDDSMKAFIKSFSGTIIASEELIGYLNEVGLINNDLEVRKGTYLLIDKYGSIKEISID